MLIRFSPDVALHLETIIAQARQISVSGVGYANWDPTKNEFQVYRIGILYIGTEEATSIPTDIVRGLRLRARDAGALRLWWHSHGFGDGYPDAENWSQSDENICRNRPLGLRPEELGWSISAVRTPFGWIGRYDIYGTNANTYHIPVLPNYALQVEERFQEIWASQTKTTSSNVLVKNSGIGSCYDREAFSDEYEETRKLVGQRHDYYNDADYGEEYYENEDHRYDDNDEDDDDSFEQFAFMGGLDPDNW